MSLTEPIVEGATKGLVQILAEIGDENIDFQILSEAFSKVSRTRPNKPGKVTFSTEARAVDGFMDGKREALIVWVDSEKLQAVVKDARRVYIVPTDPAEVVAELRGCQKRAAIIAEDNDNDPFRLGRESAWGNAADLVAEKLGVVE